MVAVVVVEGVVVTTVTATTTTTTTTTTVTTVTTAHTHNLLSICQSKSTTRQPTFIGVDVNFVSPCID